jgi:twinkle protein
VSHLRRSQGKAHEDGAQISLGELRGSQAIAQLSDIVIGMERDQQHENEEIRNTSETGPACYLAYDRSTGRLSEVPNPHVGDDF